MRLQSLDTNKADNDIAHSSEGVRAVARVCLTPILAHAYVPDVMQPVFYAPVPTPEGLELWSAGLFGA